METMKIKLSNKIYSSIQHNIVTGAISDQMFLTEKDLAEHYQVSKAPVRDALHLLCGQGYLVSYPRKGYMVRRYSRRDIQQMQQVRLQLEMLAVQLVIENASDSEIESLRKCNQPCENATDPSMPHVRPFGAVYKFDDKLYIITSNQKKVYQQLKNNAKVEICGESEDDWIRVEGEIQEDTRREARVAMLEANPGLRRMYDPDDNKITVFCFTRATATIYSFSEEPKIIRF